MSHTTKLKSIVIRDAAALVQAIADMRAEGINCSMEQNAKPRMYYDNQHEACAYVMRLPNAQYAGKTFDVGFEKQDDNTYVPVFDEWGQAVAGQVGAGASCPMPTTAEGRAQHQLGRFFQHYAKNAAMNAAAQQGYAVESVAQDADGNYQVTIAA